MLDISVKQFETAVKNKEDLKNVLQKDIKVEAKTDGVKLTLFKIANNKNINDWVVSYKGTVFYPNEFDYNSPEEKGETYGDSQFQFVFDTIDVNNNIPVNTELFCEFLMRKSTVMSEYTRNAIILIGHCISTGEVKFGKLKLNSGEMLDTKIEEYANDLGILTPPKLFNGPLYPLSKLRRSASNDKILNLVDEYFDGDEDISEYYLKLKNLLLNIESNFGGKEEGVIIKFDGKIYKIQQDYQLDKVSRLNKANKHRSDKETENAYYAEITKIANEIYSKVIDKVGNNDLGKAVVASAEFIKELDSDLIKHDKKSFSTIKDDIQKLFKIIYSKGMQGNNGSLVIGKFRILTNGHVKMINQALSESDNVVIGLVSGKDNKETNEIRKEMILSVFPNVKVIELTTGNLFTAFKKADMNINSIYCGSDRLEEYKKMVANVLGTEVKEIHRTDEDISASKVIAHLDNEEFFKANTPSEIFKFYDILKEIYL